MHTASSRRKRLMKVWALSAGIVLLGGLVLGGILFMYSRPHYATQTVASQGAYAVNPTDHVIGNPTAPIEVYMYTDLQCIYCKTYHDVTLPKLLKQYGNDLFIIYKHFPLTIHPQAYKEAEATECAFAQGGNPAFWKFVDALFSSLSETNPYTQGTLTNTAHAIGLNVDTFQKCLDTGQEKTRVNKDIAEGASEGINYMPSTIFRRNGKSVLVEGNQFGQMQAAIEYLMHK